MPRMPMLRRTRTIRAASLWKSFVVKKGSVFTVTLRGQDNRSVKESILRCMILELLVCIFKLRASTVDGVKWKKFGGIFGLPEISVQASFVRGVLEKIGVEPQVERIGEYKSAGDQLARTTMLEENCEMLTALLGNTYGKWLDIISSTR
ncbi:hypothetical protein ABKV19_014765, partial [Rosa sericea]